MMDVPEDAPPVGEEVHIPGPSILPFITAIAITLMVIGTTINWIFSGIGLAIFILAVAMWIRDTRHDMAALPEEHHH